MWYNKYTIKIGCLRWRNTSASTRRWFGKGMFPERCSRIGRLPNILTGYCECNPFFMCPKQPSKILINLILTFMLSLLKNRWGWCIIGISILSMWKDKKARFDNTVISPAVFVSSFLFSILP